MTITRKIETNTVFIVYMSSDDDNEIETDYATDIIIKLIDLEILYSNISDFFGTMYSTKIPKSYKLNIKDDWVIHFPFKERPKKIKSKITITIHHERFRQTYDLEQYDLLKKEIDYKINKIYNYNFSLEDPIKLNSEISGYMSSEKYQKIYEAIKLSEKIFMFNLLSENNKNQYRKSLLSGLITLENCNNFYDTLCYFLGPCRDIHLISHDIHLISQDIFYLKDSFNRTILFYLIFFSKQLINSKKDKIVNIILKNSPVDYIIQKDYLGNSVIDYCFVHVGETMFDVFKNATDIIIKYYARYILSFKIKIIDIIDFILTFFE